jgi:hypothetical protein
MDNIKKYIKRLPIQNYCVGIETRHTTLNNICRDMKVTEGKARQMISEIYNNENISIQNTDIKNIDIYDTIFIDTIRYFKTGKKT